VAEHRTKEASSPGGLSCSRYPAIGPQEAGRGNHRGKQGGGHAVRAVRRREVPKQGQGPGKETLLVAPIRRSTSRTESGGPKHGADDEATPVMARGGVPSAEGRGHMDHLVEEGRNVLGAQRGEKGSEDRGMFWAAVGPRILNGWATGDQVRCCFLPVRAEGAHPKAPGLGEGVPEGPQIGAEVGLWLAKPESKRAVLDFRRAAGLAPRHAGGLLVGGPGGKENLPAAADQAKPGMGLPKPVGPCSTRGP
jgi:hypothetical protein